MKIIIVGCGKVGETLANTLDAEGDDITVIDTDPEKVTKLSDQTDIMGIVGNGAVHAVQAEAGINEADLFIAVTGSDELNMLCCLIAKKGGRCRTIARIRNPEYVADSSFLQSELGLAMTINPEYIAASEIAKVLRFPSAMKVDTFAKGRVELLKFKLPEGCKLTDMTVKDVVAVLRCDVLICIIERGSEAFIPNGDSEFAEGDVISIVASPKNATEFFKKINYRLNPVKDVMIAGGGETGYYLGDILTKVGIDVKIIEKDRDRCDELCTSLPGIDVIHADATSREILNEYGIADTDGFVSLTNMDEENILLSLFAADSGKGKVVTKINRLEFDDVVKRLDLDTIIYPKNLTSDVIIRYVRAMKNTMGSNVETLYNVIKDKIEAAEFRITEGSPITDKPISQLVFKKNTLIAAILRGKKVMIPRGSDVIKAGDNVVIVSDIKALTDIKDILELR
ncbi:MAG: Trk system potassium transporter TrkA [Oscillospiraceae bacterium]|nr:Trk system potassium transporter TrkA [Oscillospiraceae bacterium]